MTPKELASYLNDYAEAVRSYQQWREQFSGDLLQRDGLIQRFEYTIELTWKTARKILLSSGLDVSATPSEALSLAQQNWLIDDAAVFMDLVRSRNRFAHMYDESEIEKEFNFIKSHKHIFDVLPVHFMHIWKKISADLK